MTDGNARRDEMSVEGAQSQFHSVMSDLSLSSAEKREALLDVARRRFGVENAHLVEIDRDADRHEIVCSVGSNLVTGGSVSDLEATFCRKTVETDGIVNIHDAAAQGWEAEVDRWGIGCYIGCKLLSGGSLYGTICLVDADPRDEGLSGADRSVLTHLSSSMSRLIEREHGTPEEVFDPDLFELFIGEVSDYAISVLDPAGHVASWNNGARNIYGYPSEEIVGTHFSRFYAETDRSAGFPERFLIAARRDGRVESEGWRVRKDGTRFWARISITALFDDDGILRGFGKVTRDLTERRRVRRALEAEQAFTERALNAIEDLFYVVDLNGEIARFNRRTMEVTGYSEAELDSADPAKLFVSEDRQAISESIIEAIETGGSVVEATLLTKDEARLEYEFRTRRLEADDGTVLGIVGIGRDITKQSMYEQRLDVAQRVLRHNLRNDLNVIKGWVEILEDDATTEQQPIIDRVLGVTDDLIDLAERTRELATFDDPSLDGSESVPVTERLSTIADRFQAVYPTATIETEFVHVEDHRAMNERRFETAVSNVVENAIEHNPDDPWVAITADADDGQVSVHVADNGPGIPDMEQRVLEQGGETPLEHSMGIGLWHTYWSVRTAGGTIEFDERDPTGSVVTLTFPSVSDD